MTDAFVASCSKFASFSGLVEGSGCKIETAEDLASEQWNAFIATNTRFENWAAMLQEARVKWYTGKLMQ